VTIPEWEKEIAASYKENPEELKKLLNAFRTLKSWGKLYDEFEWTGLFKIGTLINIKLHF